jgi:sugar-specific transcriptional regulator TrmB
MIVQKEFLNKLKDFGLNTYESKLWTALLSRGVSTAGELSDIAAVPRSRSYDVLESLEKKGFIVMKVGKPIKYVAVPPSEVIERVKKQIEDDAGKKIDVINSIRESDVLSELNNLHNQGIELVDPTELSGCLKGRGNLYNHLDSMIKSAKESVTIMTTSQGLVRQAELLKNAFEKAKKNGVKIRIAAPLGKETQKAATALSGFAEIKNTDAKSRFCVIDGTQVAFMLVDDEKVHPTYDAGVWVNTELFAATLENFFNQCWSGLKPADKFNKAA